MLKMLDLFSGIGGFSLAASWTGQIETVGFCEIESYCQKVLHKHWPNVPIYSDITKLRGEDIGAIDIVCGGFPCQPFSCAGKRRGKEDDRYLWPEMFRVIQETRPPWVVGENVANFVNMVLDDCISDLESEKYEVQAFIIPACAVNAPHRRDRVWIIANNDSCSSRSRRTESERQQRETGIANGSDVVAYPNFNGQSGDLGKPPKERCNPNQVNAVVPEGCHVAYSGQPKRRGLSWIRGRQREYKETAKDGWGRAGKNNGQWAVEPNVGRVANGIPHRVERLRGLGNAIVPQVAYQIFNAIVEAEKGEESYGLARLR